MSSTPTTDLEPVGFVEHALEKYCEWLNLWTVGEDGPEAHRYTTEQFLRYDPDNGFYGSVAVEAHINFDTHILLVFRCSDGDEGGPTTLTCYFDDAGRHRYEDPREWQLGYMVQEFDTLRQEIFNRDVKGHWVHTPTPKEDS